MTRPLAVVALILLSGCSVQTAAPDARQPTAERFAASVPQVQTARISQISQQLALSRQWIALYKAMGGGWQRPAEDRSAVAEG